jgi:3-dehydroquinate synthase
MPSFRVRTAQRIYDAVIERGSLARLSEHVPRSAGALFVVTTRDVWDAHGERLAPALVAHHHRVLFFPGGEQRKRFSSVEDLAEEMVAAGADRTSVVIAFGGGIVNDVAGFLAAIFMRGIPVIQVPTTLLAQVDAAVGGKTGVNLVSGKNLLGAFHQPLVVLIDPNVLDTLPEREYRAGLYEILKCGVIRDPGLFDTLEYNRDEVLAQDPEIVDGIIAAAVRIKAEVVSADEREGDLRRILNFGHTAGHALEAETHYTRLLHGEAVAFGMIAATLLASRVCGLSAADADRIIHLIEEYGPIPDLSDVDPERLVSRLKSDKKTLKGHVHFVLPVAIGSVQIVADPPGADVLASVDRAITLCSDRRVSA